MNLMSFELNGAPMSALKLVGRSYPAFSGFHPHVNKRSSACLVDVGPIPPGSYYVVDRPFGMRDAADLLRGVNKFSWFALYADDGRIDDETFCNKVSRGQFRLHPKGFWGISKGCITLENSHDFSALRSVLLGSGRMSIPGAQLQACGKVRVI
jgi:hypothetical protein